MILVARSVFPYFPNNQPEKYTVIPSTIIMYMYCIVELTVLSLTLEPSGPQCLLDRSQVTLTCNIMGFPRPQIIFRRNGVPIVPEQLARVNRARFDQVQ